MSTSVTNRRASQSLPGSAVLVTLDATDALELENFTAGMLCTNDSSGNTGTIHRVDYPGNTFLVSPIQPDKTFQSSTTYGYLAVSETVVVDTP